MVSHSKATIRSLAVVQGRVNLGNRVERTEDRGQDGGQNGGQENNRPKDRAKDRAEDRTRDRTENSTGQEQNLLGLPLQGGHEEAVRSPAVVQGRVHLGNRVERTEDRTEHRMEDRRITG